MITSPILGIPLGILFLAVAFGFLKIYRIPTGGMSPTLQKGDSLIATKTKAEIGKLQRGDAVVFTVDGLRYRIHRGDPMRGTYVQRIVALPGDTVTIDSGAVHVNGVRVEMDGRVSQAPMTTVETASFPLVVPEDHLFLMGDNYANSLDSRYFGPVESSRVTHLPRYRILPPSRFGEID